MRGCSESPEGANVQDQSVQQNAHILYEISAKNPQKFREEHGAPRSEVPLAWEAFLEVGVIAWPGIIWRMFQ